MLLMLWQLDMTKSLISRLTLKPEKISSLAKYVCVLADMEEPIGQILKRTELADELVLEKISCPLGAILIIFESRPDALVQIAALAIRSRNGLLLKGGKEARRSNAALHKVVISAIPDTVRAVVRDAKTDYPAACNAMETLLVHKNLSCNGGLNELILELQREDVQMYGGPKASAVLNIAEASSLHHEYSSLTCTVEIVEDVFAAIDHINKHGSAHTECIVTEDSKVAETFLSQVDSAAEFHNASTRFCDGARSGLGAEVGISTSRIHARGPVGGEGLLTSKWILRGSGQVVDGDRGVSYTYKEQIIEA